MTEIKTTTSEFKKSLKTLTDTMSDTELKEYDVGIAINCDGDVCELVMEHPTINLIVRSELVCEPCDESIEILIFMDELPQIIKKYRKKESLTISIDEETFSLSVDSGQFFQTDIEPESIAFPFETTVYELERTSLLKALEYGKAIMKKTFDESTKFLGFNFINNVIRIVSTNFAQLMAYELFPINIMGDESIESVNVSIPDNLINKIKNTIERDKTKNEQSCKLYVSNEYVVFETRTTSIAVEYNKDVVHIDGNRILKTALSGAEKHSLDLELSKDLINKQYSELLKSEENEDKDMVNSYQFLYVTNDNEKAYFTQKLSSISGYTRDLKSVLSKVTDETNIYINDNAFIIHQRNKYSKVRILFPTSNRTKKGVIE